MAEKVKIKYNKELLDKCIQRDGAILIGEYDKLKGESVITYNCKCENKHTKSFRAINRWGGALCKICCEKIQNKKIKNTFMEKYGVANPQQNKDVKEKTKQTNVEKYGTEHVFQNQLIKEKIKETNLEKYGVSNPQQNKDVKEKTKQTNLEKYGTEHVFQNQLIKEKIKETNLEKYGVENVGQNLDVRIKMKNTMIQKYGVEHNFQNGELRDKRKEIFLAKYGVEHPAQNLEIQAKSERNSKKFKEYTFPSGVIRKVQGYEPFALNELIKSYTEEQIKTDRKDVPRVEYNMKENKHYYFPDIYIPHENKIIEVKSTWTYKCKSDNIQQKGDACKAQGYAYELWCFDGKGNRVEV